MSGNRLLLDTNIILYYLSGDEKLIPLLEDSNLFISIITEIELMGYSGFTKPDLENVQKFINYCSVIGVTESVKNKAIKLRRSKKLKLPDAIILATSIVHDIPFMTADKDFSQVKSGKIILYEK
jgi:predicted nucleic acid-binding protein